MNEKAEAQRDYVAYSTYIASKWELTCEVTQPGPSGCTLNHHAVLEVSMEHADNIKTRPYMA